MTGRYVINKGTCFLSFSLAYLIILLFNNLTSSNSANSKVSENTPNSPRSSFGIIIDAGSTGSRLFLYKWSSKSDKELIDIQTVMDSEGKPVIKKVTPGLSTFAYNPEAASEYIMPLLEFASEHIPEERHRDTMVFIFATAGMRLLSIEQQNSIMKSLRKDLPAHTDLKVVPENIKVITGKWEGIYSWIAVNYMLGRFNLSNLPDSTDKAAAVDSIGIAADEQAWGNERPKTAGMIDMGGASAQIAFELPMVEGGGGKEKEEDGNTEIVNLGCQNEDRRFIYRIFVTTFLGFGVNEGAKKYEKFLWDKLAANGKMKEDDDKNGTPSILDGCLPVDFLKLASMEEEKGEDDDEGQQFVRKGDGNWDQCVSDIANLIFADNPKCPLTKSCFFGGIKAPPTVSLSHVELYGFSEYWFSVDDVLSLGGLYDHDKFEEKAKEFCRQSWKAIKKKLRAKLYPKADHDRLETQCFKSAWIHAILHNGFYVDELRNHFQSAFRINGQEVQWALGAMIYQQRYFPLESRNGEEGERSGGADGLRRVDQRLHATNAGSFGWTVVAFYLLCILALFALLWKIWRSQRSSKTQANGGKKSFRYKRLERQPSDTV